MLADNVNILSNAIHSQVDDGRVIIDTSGWHNRICMLYVQNNRLQLRFSLVHYHIKKSVLSLFISRISTFIKEITLYVILAICTKEFHFLLIGNSLCIIKKGQFKKNTFKTNVGYIIHFSVPWMI